MMMLRQEQAAAVAAGEAPAGPNSGAVRTIVNAGFSRAKPGLRRGREWLNVQGMVVLLPAEQIGTIEFRAALRLQAPVGGWRLEGYCVAPKLGGIGATSVINDDPSRP